jgi:hypothetical protein
MHKRPFQSTPTTGRSDSCFSEVQSLMPRQRRSGRMVRHFETKLDLFGEESLGRDLLLSDLEEDDLDVFNTGVTQLVPTADVGGRKIVVDRPTVMKYKTRKNFVRISLHYSKGELVRFFVSLFVLCLENQSPHIFSKQTVQGSLVYEDDAMRRRRCPEAGGCQYCRLVGWLQSRL